MRLFGDLLAWDRAHAPAAVGGVSVAPMRSGFERAALNKHPVLKFKCGRVSERLVSQIFGQNADEGRFLSITPRRAEPRWTGEGAHASKQQSFT